MQSVWLRDAIRYSLQATSHMSVHDELGPPQQQDPRFRKLVEGVLYSRRLILTYHLVILGVIVWLSAVHWTRRVLRRRLRQATKIPVLDEEDVCVGHAKIVKPASRSKTDNNSEFEGTTSSGCSTVEGTASPPRKYISEDTPLLQQVPTSRQLLPRRTIICFAKAILMYQPRPIPVLNKVLPSNGCSIAILAFLALNFFYTFFRVNLNIFELFVLADRSSLVFVANFPLLYLLAAKNQPLKFLTGRSYETLNLYHRRLGELLCLLAILHAAGMACVWYTLLRPTGFTLAHFLSSRVILLGLGTFVAYELLYFTSLASFRQWWYELFLGLHVVLQVAALVLLFFHHSGSRIYVGTALTIFLVDRLVYRFYVKSTMVDAEAHILDDDNTVKLSANIAIRPGNRLSRLMGRSLSAGWEATDHAFVTVPSLARKYIIQAHPFTISSTAPVAGHQKARLELLIRAQNGFSADLLNKVRQQNCLKLRVDGPYGSTHARTMLEDSDLAIVVAGGSGIAVAWPLIHHLLGSSRSIAPENPSLPSPHLQKIVLIWVIRKGSHLSWVGRQGLADAEYHGADIVIPRATEEIGRPDLESMINKVVYDFGDSRNIKTRIAACGPDSMGRLVRNTCSRLVRDGRNVDVTIEKFGW